MDWGNNTTESLPNLSIPKGLSPWTLSHDATAHIIYLTFLQDM